VRLCEPTEDAVGTSCPADTALPSLVRLEEGLPSLRVLHAMPASACRGTVIVLPGRGECIEKYQETVDDLLARRFAVAIVEWRGQGLSGREGAHLVRGHIEDFAHYLEDLRRALVHLDARRGARPYVMLGHSMGGHLGLRFLHDSPGVFTAAVMTAPMFDIDLKGVPARVARGLGALAVRLGGALWYAPGQRDFRLERCRFKNNPLTSCPERFARFRDLLAGQPELSIGGVTYGWLDASLRSIALTRRPDFLESIATPILICQAARERIVSNRAQDQFAARMPRAQLRRFADARHEILLERDEVRAAFFAAFEEFLRPLVAP
jgi:lysophospholipase